MTATVMMEEGVDLETGTVEEEVEEEVGEMTTMIGIRLERSLSDLDQEEVGVVGSEGTEVEIETGLVEDRVDLGIEEATEVVSEVGLEAVREGATPLRDDFA
jgi:hypothetical protein